MNERIRELAEQAGFSSGAMINIGTGEAEELWIRYNENEDREEFPNSKMMQKFAELIVQECANFIEPLGDYCGGHGEPREPSTRECAEKLKQHFGIN
jgi:hypothetical protein